MEKYKNLGKGMLLIPDADLKLAPGEVFSTEAPTKQTLLAIAKKMLVLEDPEAKAKDQPETVGDEDGVPDSSSNQPESQNKTSGPRGKIRTSKA